MICAGIDAGSRAVKIVMIDADSRKIIASGMTLQGVNSGNIAKKLFFEIADKNKVQKSDIAKVVATGYARNQISLADTTVTEITCHGRGVHFVDQDARTVIEIGGQDSKMLKLDDSGAVRDFAMNDRCAAGTGRFLEMVADKLSVSLADLGEMSKRSKSPANISSMCIVFAETEIIGLLASGTLPEDIVSGVQTSIAARVASMLGRSFTPKVVFTGGVALIPGMDIALADVIGNHVDVVSNPQMTGALGAAIIASERT